MQKYINSVYDPTKSPSATSLAISKTKRSRQSSNINIISKGSGPLSHIAPNRRSVTPTIYTGDAQSLLVLNRTVRRDLEDYIFEINEFNSKDKHELTHPTGRRFVYTLRLEERESVEVTREMRRNMEEWIADDEDTDGSSPDADGGNEREDIVKQDILETSPNSRSLEGQKDRVGKKDDSDLHKTLNGPSAHQTNSSLDALPTQHNTPPPEEARPRLRRTSSTLSLAALIATADENDFPIPDNSLETDSDSESYPDCTIEPPAKPTFIIRPCHDPSFPDHALCATHPQQKYGWSSKTTARVLKSRRDKGWEEGNKPRGVGEVKVVQGSGLSYKLEVVYKEDQIQEENDVTSSSTIDEVEGGALVQLQDVVEEAGLENLDPVLHGNGTRHSLPHCDNSTSNSIVEDLNSTGSLSAEKTQDIAEFRIYTVPLLLDVTTPAPRIIHIRNASMNNVLSDISSTRTTVVSKQASITTKSSQSSMSVQSIKFSRLIDALDLGISESKARDSRSVYKFEPPTLSVDNLHIPSDSTSVTAEDGDGLGMALTMRTHTCDDLLLEVGSGHALCGTGSAAAVLYDSEDIDTRLHYIDSTYSYTRASAGTDFVFTPLSSESHGIECAKEIADNLRNQSEEKLSRHGKWYSKLSRTVMKIPGKARDSVKATKKFGRTLRAFVR